MLIKVNEIHYNVEMIGQGESLLLLHGFTGSLHTWDPFVEEWSKNYTLILVDLIGHGKTEHPENYRRYFVEQTCVDLKEILRILEIKKTHVLGYSMGGRVAISFSILNPNHVSSLILESSSPGLELEADRLQRRENDNRLADRIEESGIPAFVDYWENIPLFRTQKERMTALQKQALRNERLQNSSIGLANSLRGMGTGAQPSWWSKLKDVNHPVLLLAGELDQKFCAINNEMKKHLSNAQISIIKDAGHAIHVEQSELFGKIVKDYLIAKDNQ